MYGLFWLYCSILVCIMAMECLLMISRLWLALFVNMLD